MLERIRLVDFFGNVNELELSGLEIDVPVDVKEFTLEPPEGTDVIDGLKGE
jgi:outer membrane lipoprotein carrier protein